MIKRFKIGEFAFQVDCPQQLPIPENFLVFEDSSAEPSYFYKISIDESVYVPKGALICQREDILIFDHNGKESRLIGVKGESEYYASYEEVSKTEANISVLESKINNYSIDPFFTSFFALEKRLLDRNAIVLHCAYIENQGEAILFSAPSETGKTTQANLWDKYRNTRQINGDRALLHKADGSWYASGWPVCGTSECCFNKKYPVHAIVMLSQAPDNAAERLPFRKAFSQVYSQITINRWNTEAHNKAMSLIEDLIVSVPVYHLACNISEDAVKCLEKTIYM